MKLLRTQCVRRDETVPKVLISDKLSPRAVDILESRGVEVDVKTGLDPAELAAIIGEYDGLAIRSATKVTEEILAAADGARCRGDEHAAWQCGDNSRARHLDDPGAGPPDSGGE